MGPLLPKSFMNRVTSSGRATGSDRFYQPKNLGDKSYALSKMTGKNSFSRLNESNQGTQSADPSYDTTAIYRTTVLTVDIEQQQLP